MPETSKNAPCPCGSRKKYKRCCIDKPTLPKPLKISSFKNSFEKKERRYPFLDKYNSFELFKLFALLQLHPQNHGKNIRLELVISELLNNVNNNTEEINFDELINDIQSYCTKHYFEDPPEESFTENIVFENGNNIVYNGISNNGTEIVQGLINAISISNNLPKEFLVEARSGILLILYILNEIAKSLGHTHRQFEESKSDSLILPSVEEIKYQNKIFSFSAEDINNISQELRIPQNTINAFVFDWENNKLNSNNPDDNPLFQKPIIKIRGEFILVMPTSELTCLNEFILNTAIKYNCLEILIQKFVSGGFHELYPLLGRMNWKPIKFNFSQIDGLPNSFHFTETLWQFDVDKLAYVSILTEKPEFTQNHLTNNFSNQFTKRVNNSVKEIRKKNKDSQIFLINCSHKSRVLGIFNLALNDVPGVSQYLFLDILILQVLIYNWKFDTLTLWKYAKYLNLAENQIKFAPVNSHLAKFDWYKRNHDSFFHSDDEPFNSAFFDLGIEGDVRRKGLKKLDKIGIPILIENQFGYLQCIRKEEYYPVYISQEIYYGEIRNCLLKYDCPIWVSSVKERDFKADIYMNGILYWLNELYIWISDYINQLKNQPISIKIEIDEGYYEIKNLDLIRDTEAFFNYKIDKRKREIHFKLPIQLIQDFSSSNNLGEQYLMSFILHSLGDLISELSLGDKMNSKDIDKIIKDAIPLGHQKMILIANGERDIKIADIDVIKPRKIPEADISYILQNQASWLKYTSPIPRKIKTPDEKKKLLNDLVAMHLSEIENKITKYDFIPLLTFLMRRHESLIQKRAFRQINYPAKQACFGKYYNVFEEFSKSELELNESNLAMRVLIEFTACIEPKGNKIASDDDIDILLAHTLELFNYGAISDEISSKIQNPDVGLLPSGRIGIDNRFSNNTLKDFKKAMYAKEFSSYEKDFEQFFSMRQEKKNEDKDPYVEKVNNVFKEEWGIALFDIAAICFATASHLFETGKSVDIISNSEFINLLKKLTVLDETEITAFIGKMSFVKRESIAKEPKGFFKWEVYPWRYNRRLSYLLKPLIQTKINDQNNLVLSARHLLMSSENLISLFYKGRLKVDKEEKKIIQLLAERNAIRGYEYREKVFHWLKNNTDLTVYPYEVKIRPKGFFKNPIDIGDIDILAINNQEKIIYSIECKNTSQSKISYDFKSEIDNYLGIEGKEGLIQKHITRHNWLTKNKDYVISTLKLSDEFVIKSFVISKSILPLVNVSNKNIPIYSFDNLINKKLVL